MSRICKYHEPYGSWWACKYDTICDIQLMKGLHVVWKRTLLLFVIFPYKRLIPHRLNLTNLIKKSEIHELNDKKWSFSTKSTKSFSSELIVQNTGTVLEPHSKEDSGVDQNATNKCHELLLKLTYTAPWLPTARGPTIIYMWQNLSPIYQHMYTTDCELHHLNATNSLTHIPTHKHSSITSNRQRPRII